MNLGCESESKDSSSNEKSFDLKLMTWNIWGRLNLDPRYTIDGKTARERVIEILKGSKADVITMTETYGSAEDIAQALNFNYYTPSPDANLTIFSRYPLVSAGNIEGLSPFSFIAATVQLPDSSKVKVYNIWLTSGGRHIVEIKNDTLSDSEFDKGDEIRYNHILELLNHESFKKDMANRTEIPVIVAGDFNCVSHLDYTPETKRNGLNFSRILSNKVSMAMLNAGFIDSYRSVNSTISTETLGYTWTTVGQGYVYKSGQGFVPVDKQPEPEYRDPFARIDFIYATGERIEPVKSKTIVNHPSNLSRSFPEFPSDHGAVLTTFKIK